jgi:hypothetical protein
VGAKKTDEFYFLSDNIFMWGHRKTVRLLTEFTSEIKSSVAPNPTPSARILGNEFLLMFEHAKGGAAMAKGESKGNREKRKPKSETPKNKVPNYMSGGGLSAAKPASFSIGPGKSKK